MDTETLHPTCIAAFVDEAGQYDHVVDAAVDLASANASRLILYDSSSASAFREPVASSMSAEGVGDDVPSLLSQEDLERLGHHTLAERVRAARAAGVDAYGRLASDHGAEPFLAFARSQGADLILVPQELEDPGVVERLRGETAGDARDEAGGIRVLTVDRTGRLAAA
ncbi:MAG TPA: hypothetical protein VID47_13650 [Actinomycetota bacterium]|jgi:nucleotide-binding universal stress UspA family protein